MAQQQSLLILYATQTGCAQELAEKLSRDASRRNFSVRLESVDTYNRATLASEPLVLFLASTTGDGDPPDTMRAFWRFLLRKALPRDALRGVNFTVFGLGDSSYDKFNSVGRKLRKRLLQLGASEVAQSGWGDDQSEYGVEGDFDRWSHALWEVLLRKYPLPQGFVVDDTPRLPEFSYRVITGGVAPDRDAVFFKSLRKPIGCFSEVVVGSMRRNERLCAQGWEQDVRHIEFELAEAVGYEAGDIAVVFPENSCVDVGKLCARLGLDSQRVVRVEKSGKEVIYGPCTVSDLFLKYLDVLGTPKRSALEALAFSATDEDDKEKLLELSSPEGNDLYASYCKKEGRTFVDLLEDFHSLRPPLEHLVEIIPRLAPREYSISSSPSHHGKTVVHLTVALVQYLTPWKRMKRGTCSQFLENSRVGQQVAMCFKRGTLRVPEDPSATLICVGPGTGVAPMRSLVYERLAHQKSLSTASGVPSILYFGCRHETEDYLYQEEWTSLLEKKGLEKLRVAFSRDTPGRKVYVQSLLKADKLEVYRALAKPSTYLFISGSAKRMPADVKERLVDIIAECGEREKIDAKKVVQGLERQGRLKIEAWS